MPGCDNSPPDPPTCWEVPEGTLLFLRLALGESLPAAVPPGSGSSMSTGYMAPLPGSLPSHQLGRVLDKAQRERSTLAC